MRAKVSVVQFARSAMNYHPLQFSAYSVSFVPSAS